MLGEIALGLGGYLTGGLLTGRQVKFWLENRIDDAQGRVDATPYGRWRKRHVGHPMNRHYSMCLTCYDDDTAPRRTDGTGMPRMPGSSPETAASIAGVLWPLAIPTAVVGFTGKTLGRATVKAAKPAVHWFFENPRRRKEARNKITA